MMATGASAHVHRAINRPHLLARNESHLSVRSQGHGQLRLRQLSRQKIHTACRTVLPPRSSLGPLSANTTLAARKIIRGNGPYAPNCPTARGLANTSHLGSQEAAEQRTEEDRSPTTDQKRVRPSLRTGKTSSAWQRLLRSIPNGPGISSEKSFKVSENLDESNPDNNSHSLMESIENALQNSQSVRKSQKQALRLKVSDDLAFALGKDATANLIQANSFMKAQKPFRKVLPENPGSKIKNIEPSKPRVYDFSWRDEELKNSKSKVESSLDPNHQAMRKQVEDLPIRQHKDELLNLINNNVYSICNAQTGSGKSTQVPQLILDDAISKSKGSKCRILVVQPRRIATTGLARRVAAERHESIGDTVGYSVRFEHRPAKPAGSITFCTTGMLLNRLRSERSPLDDFSHIILDEVHTRDVSLDVAMKVLRDGIDRRTKAGKDCPRLILMSATADIPLFSSYFQVTTEGQGPSPAPHITIPGRTYPVKKHYLEEVIQNLALSLPPYVLSELIKAHPPTDEFLNAHFKVWGDQSANPGSFVPRSTRITDELKIASGLVSATIMSLLANKKQGDFLAFVPGMFQMDEIISQLKETGPLMGLDFADPCRFKIIRLHSELPLEQLELSVEVPEGCQRIILATDIAETSLTLTGVRHVIDTGKHNQRAVDTELEYSAMYPRWVDMASAEQRAGRAGRVQEGDYYFLGSSKRFENLQSSKTADIHQSSLEETSLHLRKMITSEVPLSTIFNETIEPPSEDRVASAVQNLKNLGAFDSNENLTELGIILEKLDMDPAYGKMILLGAIFKCLDPMVIIASLGPKGGGINRRRPTGVDPKHVQRVREELSNGTLSDHMVYINSFRAIRDHRNKSVAQIMQDGTLAEGVNPHWNSSLKAIMEEFADSLLLDSRAFTTAAASGRIILGKMRQANIKSVNLRAYLIQREAQGQSLPFGTEDANRNSDNTNLIKALLVHCLAPNLAIQKSFSRKVLVKPGVPIDGTPFLRSGQPLVHAYAEKFFTQSSGMNIAESTRVSPLTACILSNKLEVEQGQGQGQEGIVLDSWLRFKVLGESLPNKEVAEDLVQHHKVLNDALHTAFATFTLDVEKLSRKDKKRFYAAQQRLFASLREAIDVIVGMDSPMPSVEGPSRWLDEFDDEELGG
ncbi:unnamed protein product [Penicillium olsonii]|nr:unnamed protein product [Penicillium olsonii]